MKYIAAIVIALFFTGCVNLPAVPQNDLVVGPTPAPLTINQFNQQPRVRISGRSVNYANRDDGAPVIVAAPAPGQISAGGPGSACRRCVEEFSLPARLAGGFAVPLCDFRQVRQRVPTRLLPAG